MFYSLIPYIFKMSTFCHSTLPTTTSNGATYSLDCCLWSIIFEVGKFYAHWISRYQSHDNIASRTSLGIVQNLHDCISTLVISGTSLSSAPNFRHILHRSISDSCYCCPCWWWCIKFNPSTSLNFNILHFHITL